MQFMEYRHPGSLSATKFKTLRSAAKVMLTTFCEASGVIYSEFLTKGLTVNSDSGSTSFLHPRFGTVGCLDVTKIEGDVSVFQRIPKLRQPSANGCAANQNLSSRIE
ncbi:hypothetical protein TNCV_558601 [Trichonephila clavipes]|nr:hypothetical protein TNCV_558601 [Trichonephila clavipes]